MLRFKIESIEQLRQVLDRSDYRGGMKVEVQIGISLPDVSTVADLRSLTSLPHPIVLVTPERPERPESVIKIEA